MSSQSSRPVVVGVDGSPSALAATRWAAAEAGRRGAPLRLVTAFPVGRGPLVGDPAAAEEHRRTLRGRAERQLHDAVDAAERVVPGVVSGAVVVGSAIGTLVEEARHARLLVLGSRGRGGLTGLLLGSVAIALAARAACPVVVVRGADREPAGALPVLLGVDESPVSDAAIAFAFEAAAARGAPLLAVHGWLEHIYDAQVAVLVDADGLEEGHRRALANRMAGWAQKYPDVPLTQLVARDGPARALVERSREAQLLVVGSHGRGNLAGLVLGSVSHAVLQHSHCPVAVVRPSGG